MANVTLTPDSGFARELMDAGADSLKKCYQCATCSVACPMAPANSPYPRKEMVWASWGQKDRLLSDPDIWLCHNCGNCAELCPRGAKPADVMAACRNIAYKKLVKPAKVGEWMSSPKGLPIPCHHLAGGLGHQGSHCGVLVPAHRRRPHRVRPDLLRRLHH